jgi:hypothetical protein
LIASTSADLEIDFLIRDNRKEKGRALCEPFFFAFELA